MEKVYGNVRPLPKEKGTRRRRRSDRRNRAQAQAVVLFVIVAVISVLQAYFTSRREVQM